MALFSRSKEYQIGRGEVAESRIEAPFIIALMVFFAAALLAVHLAYGNDKVTLALAISMVVFSITTLRVDLGVYFLIVAMLLSPEITAGPVGIKNRALNVRYDDVLIVTIFLGVIIRIAWEGRPRLWRLSPANSGIALYYGVCVFSTLLAVRRGLPYFDPHTAFFVLLKMAEFYMIFFLVGNAIVNLDQIRRQLVLFFIVAVIISVFGIYQVGAIDRVSAPFEQGGTEPNTLGGYLVIVMCVAAGLYTQAPTPRKRLLCVVLTITAFFPFLFTLSRASYLALLAGLLALAFMGRSWLIFGTVVGVLALSSVLMPAEVKDRVNSTFQRGDGVPVTTVSIGDSKWELQVDKSTNERIYVWKKVWYGLKFWPWFGGGVSWDTVLDSQYARVIIETGLIGLAAFLFMQYRILRMTREAYLWSRDWVGRGVALGAFCSMVALIVHSLGTISFLIVRIMEPFWLVAALAVVVREVAIRDYVIQRRQAEQAIMPELETGRQPA